MRALISTVGMQGVVDASPLTPKYSQAIDRESAYEMLAARVHGAGEEAAAPPAAPANSDAPQGGPQPIPIPIESAPAPTKREKAEPDEPGMFEQVMDNPMMKSMMRSAGTALGREITRSLFGTARRRRR